jgi:hypothetical protein
MEAGSRRRMSSLNESRRPVEEDRVVSDARDVACSRWSDLLLNESTNFLSRWLVKDVAVPMPMSFCFWIDLDRSIKRKIHDLCLPAEAQRSAYRALLSDGEERSVGTRRRKTHQFLIAARSCLLV